MPGQPAVQMPCIAPMLLYEDVAAALAWLSDAFGFRERLRYAEGDGIVTHAEMSLADGVIMLGHPGPAYQSPRRTGQVQTIVHVYVDDVDGHFTRARDAGATILEEPTDMPYGDRRYMAEDLEGHHWMVAQRVRELAPTDWGAVEAK